MAKIPRVTAKIFASNAAPDDIGQYGSALTGTKVLTSDIAEIQALPAYETGWRGAVISNRNYPTLQETNGLQKTFSQQIAYTLQNGMPEWDEGTTYYTNQFCRVANDFYYSLSDDNIGNNPKLDNTNWALWAPGLDTYANQDLSNLTPAGEKHFINYTQATNCITELPERIKYTLVDGVLTLLAGSVVIVPYGTEDLTETYPVGSTFIHDNFKVVDTQYALDPQDNISKFFVWVEVQNDIVSLNSALENATSYMLLSITENTLYRGDKVESGTSTTASHTYTIYYNTNSNYIGEAGNSTTIGYSLVKSFPVMITTSANEANTGWKSVNQVFNGIGFIGGCVWVDKGIKALIPNGKNPDGSFKSIVYNEGNLRIYNQGHLDVDLIRELMLCTDGTFVRSNYFYVNDKGYLSSKEGNIFEGFTFALIMCKETAGVISNFRPYQALLIADAQHYVKKNGDILYGPLTFNTTPETNQAIVAKDIKSVRQVTPSTNNYVGIMFTDKNGSRMGELEHAYANNGQSFVSINELRVINGQNVYSRISVGFNNDNTPFAIAPTPQTANNSTAIATTAWSHRRIQAGVISLRNTYHVNVTFPYAFPRAPKVVITQYTTGDQANATVYGYKSVNVTTTGFTIWSNNQTNTCHWIAVLPN